MEFYNLAHSSNFISVKKILVGMDFSNGALNAFNYAVDVAKSCESQIILLWVESNSSEKLIPGEKNEFRHESKLELEKIISDNKKRYPQLNISFKQKKGKVYKEFASVVLANDVGLAIIGTHGIGGFEEFWVGSNAYKIISYCPCPVISVRTDYKKGGNIKKIVLPIDDSIDTTKKVPMAAQLAKELNADIEVLGIYESNLPSLKRKTDHYLSETKQYLSDKNIIPIISICKSNNISTSIVKYAEKNEADLMVIMTDQNKATSDIIMGIRSQQIINRSPIPVLSVKPFKMEVK